MNWYIFITNEGYTYQPNSESNEPDCENAQVLGIGLGNDDKEQRQATKKFTHIYTTLGFWKSLFIILWRL